MRGNLYTALCVGIAMLIPVISEGQLTAKFGSDIRSGCSPIVVNFSDSSTGSPVSWNWNLGNGATSTLENPSTTYINPGKYTITLTVTSGTATSTVTDTGYITVLASPAIAFSADTSAKCPPLAEKFTNTTISGTGSPASYLWDFGDGGSDTLASPSHTYSTSGTYNVTLVAVNSNGCKSTLTKTSYINVSLKPTASFTASNNNSCVMPAKVTFTNTTTNISGAISYKWYFGDGSTDTAANPVHTYTASGSYDVTLIAVNANGCSDTVKMTKFANIGDLQAVFAAPKNGCVGAAISFTNTSTPATAATYWYFGDGDTATAFSPDHTYTSSGTYTVKLVETTATCSDSVTQAITINGNPKASFSESATSGCTVPIYDTFTNTSSGATSYIWYFGDGSSTSTASPVHRYTSYKLDTVKLVAISSSGCVDTSAPAVINLAKAAFTISDVMNNYCAPETVNFKTTATSLSSYTWYFGDGATASSPLNPSHAYSSAGNYTIKLKYVTAAGCSDSASVGLTLNTPASLAFTDSPTTKVCPNVPFSFKNSSSGATSYLWLFGDSHTSTATNPTHTYQPGTYNVSLVGINGKCRDTLTKDSLVATYPPTVRFGFSVDCNNRLNVTFYNDAIGDSTDKWAFGDGTTSTSTARSITHTYTSYGNYYVTLAVVGTGGACLNGYGMTIDLKVPTPGFSANNLFLCSGKSVKFTADSSSDFLQYTWNIGSGSTTTKTDTFSKTFTTTGIYSVTLIAKDIDSCQDTVLKNNYIHVGGPIGGFSATPLTACAPAVVSFTDTSYDAITINSRKWSLGNGDSSIGNKTSLTETYNAGSYNVQLLLVDSLGCRDTVTKNNYISLTRPTAYFVPTDTVVCTKQNITFNNYSAGTGNTYSWDFGDGATSAAISPVHAYTNGGVYAVTLIARNSSGCSDTMIVHIDVKGIHMGFEMSDSFATCPPFFVSFKDTSTGVTSRLWTFGNGSTSVYDSPSVVYVSAGNYVVTLKGQNDIGCSDSLSKSVVVEGPRGSLSYTAASGCFPVSVTLTSIDTNAAAIYWDMNNGYAKTDSISSPSTNTFSYTYTTYGKYVPVVVLTGGACHVAIKGKDTITSDHLTAAFSFSPDSSCSPALVQFTDTALTTFTGVSSWNWDFGDGTASTSHNPSHTYNNAGVYIVTLIMKNANGCADTVTKRVTVFGHPAVSAGNDTTICKSSTITLIGTGASTYQWYPSAGLSCTACDTAKARIDSNVTYYVIGTNIHGCSDTASINIGIHSLPVVTADSNLTVCSHSTVKLIGYGAVSYTWYPTSGLSCPTCDTTIDTPAVSTTLTLVGKDGNGCVDTAKVPVKVNPLPVIKIDSSQTICQGLSVQLFAHGAKIYSWSPATGLSCSSCDSPFASPSVSTAYLVTGTDSNGCSDTGSVHIKVNSLPVIKVTSSKAAICIGDTATLTAGGAKSYSWSPATGLQCTSCDSTLAYPSATATYHVTGTDSNGCSDTGSITLKVNSLPVVTADSNLTVCSHSTVKLIGYGAVSYAWYPTSGLSCPTCDTTIDTPAVSTTLTLVGKDGNGCVDTAKVPVKVNPLPVIKIDSSQTICQGLSVQLFAHGAKTYSWSPATGLSCSSCDSPFASPSVSTAYLVTGTDSNGCSDTGSVHIKVNSLPVIKVTSSKAAICIGDTATLTAGGAKSYSWSPATGLQCTSCDSTLAYPSATATYHVTGTDSNGCSDTGSITLKVNSLPVVTADSNLSSCSGGPVKLIGYGALAYTWYPSSGLSCATCDTTIATPSVSTTYTVVGTDINGCTDSAKVPVNVHALPVITIDSNYVICLGTSVQLFAHGAKTYSWSPAKGLSCSNCDSPFAKPAASTTYLATGTDSNGCSDTGSVRITVNSLPLIVVSPPKSICIGDTATLTVSGAKDYSWYPVSYLSCFNCDSTLAYPNVTTIYHVNGTDSNGCSDTASIKVTVNSLPVVTTDSNLSSCSGGPVKLIGYGAATYLWYPAGGLSCPTCDTTIATPRIGTTYTVVGTDINGCTDSAKVSVKVNALPDVTADSSHTICQGTTVQLFAHGAKTYSWSPPTALTCSTCANPFASPAVFTTYTVTGTDTNGCSDTASVNIYVNSLPVLTVTPSRSICIGDTALLTVSGAQNYAWYPSSSLSCTNCDSTLAHPDTTVTYYVAAVDSNGCRDTASAVITVNKLPVLTIDSSQSVCKNSTVQLFAHGAVRYIWTPDSSLSCDTCASPFATPPATIQYHVTGTDANGCAGSDSVTLTILPLPALVVSADQNICAGASAHLVASGAATYSWSPATGLSSTTGDTTTATPAATITYLVTGKDSSGCADTAQVLVKVNPLPVLTILPGTSITVCGDSTVQITVSGADTYTWTPATSLSCSNCANPVAHPADNINYTVVGADTTGCKDSLTVAISVIRHQPTSVNGNDTLCSGASASLLATGGTSYSWSPAAGLSNTSIPNPTATPGATTTYTVLISQGVCYVDTANVTVVVNPNPVLTLSPDQTIIEGGAAQLSASGAYVQTYSWSPPDGLNCDTCATVTASPKKTTKYTVAVATANGCTAQGDVTVFVNCNNDQLFIPNTFTPNGDGANDVFYISGKGIATVKRFSVYNRWGELVFDAHDIPINNPSYGWDGTYKGQKLPPDVFVYVIDATCESGEPLELKGDISLLR